MKRETKGFTLIEMLVVISVIGILMTIVSHVVRGVLERQKISNTRGLLRRIAGAISTTEKAEGYFPVESTIVGLGNRNLEVSLCLQVTSYLDITDNPMPSGALPPRLAGQVKPFTRSANYQSVTSDFGSDFRSVENFPGTGTVSSFHDITSGLTEVISVKKDATFGSRVVWTSALDPADYQAPFVDAWYRPIVIEVVVGKSGFNMYSFGPKVYINDNPANGFFTADDIILGEE